MDLEHVTIYIDNDFKTHMHEHGTENSYAVIEQVNKCVTTTA